MLRGSDSEKVGIARKVLAEPALKSMMEHHDKLPSSSRQPRMRPDAWYFEPKTAAPIPEEVPTRALAMQL